MTPAIRFSHVSKKFALDVNRARSLQELFVQRKARPASDRIFWALRDVTFDIQSGERVALIGTNGSGKSTLLKLISKVIQPTSGQIETHGRVVGLLELGTGFHPDLTGRENIFLNASILGVPRAAIKQQLEAIIDFADIGPFIDTQVRNYSSGMIVRLGFAITTALEPDILLIDEVLAVGDQNFQRKCFARLEDLRAQGTTLIFVSHSMEMVNKLCHRAIWIEDSSITLDGDAEIVSGKYLDAQQPMSTTRHASTTGVTSYKRWGTYQAEVTRVELLDRTGQTPAYFVSGDLFRLRLHYVAHERVLKPAFGIGLFTLEGARLNSPNSFHEGCPIPYIEGTGYVDYVLESLPLNQGDYELTAAIYSSDLSVAYDHHHRMYPVRVRPRSNYSEEGAVHFPARWEYVPRLEPAAPA
jgi:ABC-type polysaccharide/polyol phosphate transport system ATPase subunit